MEEAVLSGLQSSISFDEDYFPTRAEVEEEVFSESWMKEAGQTGVIRDVNGLPYYDPNQAAMHPYRARGLMYDHGDLHKIFFYDPVVSGVFSLMLVEVMRAYWHATHYREESPIEKKRRRILEITFGLDSPTHGQEFGVMEGGLSRLIFHLFWANLYGFSINELTWDYVSTEYGRMLLPVGCRYRAPWTVYRWVHSNDRLVGFTQLIANVKDKKSRFRGRRDAASLLDLESTTDGHGEVFVPIDKCLIRSNRAIDGNPEGISDFRTSYIYVKAKVEQVIRDQISEERLANGVVLIKEGGNEYGPYKSIGQEDRDSLKLMLAAFSQGKTNRIAIPFGIDFDIMWPTYNRPDNTDKLEWLDKQIMLGSTSSLLGLDATRAASRGLSDSLATLAFHAIANSANEIRSVINGVPGNRGTGLVRKIFEVNGLLGGGGRSVSIEHFGIEHQDGKRLIESLARGNQMLVINSDSHDEIKYRKAANLGSSDIKSIEKQREKVVQQNGQLVSQGEQAVQKQPNQSKNKQTDGNNDPVKK